MYATDDGECKFGKAIPLPSYHHVHQVGSLICDACVYIKKKDCAYIYIALAEILLRVVPRLYDTADFNRNVRSSYVGRNSEASLKLSNKGVHVMRVYCKRDAWKGSQFYRDLKEI